MFDSATLGILTGKFVIGLLFFIRISGLMASGPFFKHAAIPAQVKIFLTLIITFAVSSAYWRQQPVIDMHLWVLALLAIKELLVGVMLGFAADVVFMAASFGGGLVDFDMGYQTSMLFDSSSDTPSLIGNLYSMSALMLFIFLDGHLFLVEAIFASARAVPLTYFEVTGSTVQLLIRLATSVLIIGVKMAAPALIALFLTNLALALLARIAPQTNIFILSFQLKVVVGLLTLMGSVPLFVMISKYFLQAMESEAMKLLLSLNPGRV